MEVTSYIKVCTDVGRGPRFQLSIHCIYFPLQYTNGWGLLSYNISISYILQAHFQDNFWYNYVAI